MGDSHTESEALARLLSKYDTDSEKNSVKEILRVLTFYEDHPIKGHPFVDVFPLFRYPHLVTSMVSAFSNHIHSSAHFSNITALLVLEARGFIFGPLIAASLGLPWVPVRKQRKLPGTTVSVSYAKEYEEDTFEIKTDAFEGIPEGDVVLLDDLVAMGGSAAAGKGCVDKLMVMMGERRKVVEACFIFGIPELTVFVQEKMKETELWSWIELEAGLVSLLPRGN